MLNKVGKKVKTLSSFSIFVCLITFHYISGDDFDFPVSKYDFQMVSSPDKKTLYAIGGYGSSKEIYKSQCNGDINSCKWIKSNTELKNGRGDFVAMSIPNSLADNLCG